MSNTCAQNFFSNDGTIFSCPLTPAQILVISQGVFETAKKVFPQYKQMNVDTHLKTMRVGLLISVIACLLIVIWVGSSFVMIDHISMGTFFGIVAIGVVILGILSYVADYYLRKNISTSFDGDMAQLSQSFLTQFGTLDDLQNTNKPIGEIFADIQKTGPPSCPCPSS